MGENQISVEADNVIAPIKNTNVTKAIAVLIAGPTSQSIDLASLFGNVAAGHYFTAQADGAKVYVALGAAAGSIDESAAGISTLATATLACVLIADQTEKNFRLAGGLTNGTGIATQIFASVLHYKTPTGIVTLSPTGYLRIYRSSLGTSQGLEQFKGPLTGF